ncbi:hypothetical protein [Paraburkholderia sp. J12]|uniref:hypothetical protein n=1 Tax=Paraburkholderia sp. J12 TaxID=2805432 RepID=UPI002ABD92D6|nr:hypothetical protein [Paraburkholderia sp. J12]
MLALFRGEMTGAELDVLLADAGKDPAIAQRLADWRSLATLAVDEHVEATRADAFAAFELRLAAARAYPTTGESGPQAASGTAAPRAAPVSARMGWRDRAKSAWRAWLAGGTAGLRPVLVALTLVQAGVIGVLLHDRDSTLAGAAPVWRGGANPCERAVVSLAPGASVDDLIAWLGMNDATLQGPDANGHFTLIASDPAALRTLLADPAAKHLVTARQSISAACESGR